MTPYSLNPPAGSGPSLQGHAQQLFVSPSNQDCPTLFNIFDQRQTIEIGGFRENYYQQDENKMVLQDGSSSNSNSSEAIIDDTSNTCEANNLTSNKMKEEDSKNNIGHGSGKWMSSKMRLMKKMMSSTTDKALINPSPRFQNQGHESKYSQRSPRNNNSSTTRVCSDCNTSSTPLWRSGPKGPKSLCNACGIRQRKARRAMAEAANGVPTNAACAKTRVHNKEKKSRANHFTQLKNKFNKSTTTTTTTAAAGSSEGVRKLEYFNDFAISLRSNSSFQQVFPRDEVAEAAMLLMDLSCGLVH